MTKKNYYQENPEYRKKYLEKIHDKYINDAEFREHQKSYQKQYIEEHHDEMKVYWKKRYDNRPDVIEKRAKRAQKRQEKELELKEKNLKKIERLAKQANLEKIANSVKATQESKDYIRSMSNKFAHRKLNCDFDGTKHQIHHCFGYHINSFVIMKKSDHIDLHKKFGKKNDDCLITNESVKKFIESVPHVTVQDGIIKENTFNV